jgi:hypothetical protein
MTTSSVSKQDTASCCEVLVVNLPIVNLETGIAGKLTNKLLNNQLKKQMERETEKRMQRDR